MGLSISHVIVAATGLGYLLVGLQQFWKLNVSGGIIWTGYAFAQIGLYMTVK